jgi:hypothetical protein
MIIKNNPIPQLYPQLLGKIKSISQLIHIDVCKNARKIFLENALGFSIRKLTKHSYFCGLFKLNVLATSFSKPVNS